MKHLITIAVKHAVCWLYQFCQEVCKHTVLQLPTAVFHAPMIPQFSVQGCASQEGAQLCVWCMSFTVFPCALSVLSEGNMNHALARHGKEDFTSHMGSKSSPININPVVLEGRKPSYIQMCVYTGIMRSIPLTFPSHSNWVTMGKPSVG